MSRAGLLPMTITLDTAMALSQTLGHYSETLLFMIDKLDAAESDIAECEAGILRTHLDGVHSLRTALLDHLETTLDMYGL